MKALILATGNDRAPEGAGGCGPLLRIAGLSLLERTVATAMRAGIDEFVVVIGREADRTESLLLEVARRRRVSIRIMRAKDEQATSGALLLAARECLTEPFVLLPDDQVFDDAILDRLLDRGLRSDACVLAVDQGWPARIDPMRVSVQADRIVGVGGQPDCRSCAAGVLLCTPAVFDAAARALSRGDGTVCGAIRELAREDGVAAVDVPGGSWLNVTSRRDARRAAALLTAPSGKSRDGWVSRNLNRPLSRRVLTPLLLRLYPAITANQVSALGFAVGLGAAAAFAVGQPLLGGVALHLASVLDGSDGEIARLKRLESPFGQFLDAAFDRYTDSVILMSMLFFAWTAEQNRELFGPALATTALAIGTLAVSGHWLVSYTTARAALDLNHRYDGRWIGGGRGRDLRLLVLASAGVAAAVHPAAALLGLAVIAGLTNTVAIRRILLSRAEAGGGAALAEIEAVVYDLDGTVLDSMPALTAIATTLVATSYGTDADVARERYLATVGADFATQLAEMYPGHPANEGVAAAFERRKDEVVSSHRLFDDSLATLQFFRAKGVRQFVCSSTRNELVGAALLGTGLLPYLDGWSGYQAGLDKSRQISRMVREHRLDPARTLFVGDAPRDTTYAQRAGVRFCGLARSIDGVEFARLGAAAAADLRSLTRSWESAARIRGAVSEGSRSAGSREVQRVREAPGGDRMMEDLHADDLQAVR
ncbi:MAG: HAD family hydrolase [Dehalococcoidia bacterium]